MNRTLYREHTEDINRKTLACLASIFRWSFVALVMLPFLGWGQETGLYYIANNNNNAFNPDNSLTNWYLVPASNGGDPNIAVNRWALNDNEDTPLVTTYQTLKDNNSVWAVVSSGDFYYLIHVLTNKYMTYNTPVGANTNRRAFHMETTSAPGDASLFTFKEHTGTPVFYSINPKNKTSGHMYLNPSNGNKPTYYASETQDGGYWIGGTIGIYNKNATGDDGSKWFLEPAILPAPTISFDAQANTFSIEYNLIPAGFDILYTTDGSIPTIGGSATHTYSESVPVTGTYTVKAVVARYGLVLTEVASLPVGVPNPPEITLPEDCRNLIQMDAGDSPVYYTLDGTNPDDQSPLYIGPFPLNEAATIKAVAYNGALASSITTKIYSPPYTPTPTITLNGITIVISGNGTIYYTTNGDDPVPGEGTTMEYNSSNPPRLPEGSGQMTIKAVAKEGSKELSCVAELTTALGYFITDVNTLNRVSDHLNQLCIVANDFDASGFTSSISGFTGTFDGGYHTISGMKKPLFSNLKDATVKNVVFSGVNITSETNVGAICDIASGSTKIYNCGILSGSVTGSENVGGLVGLIKEDASVRVVNCYNYANVSGDKYAAGIVGKNEGTVGDVRIALCMMYGNVTDADNISPVYGGNHASNDRDYSEYNFWRYRTGMQYDYYNDQLAIDKDEYLSRFPFYRHILNTHRELGAFFLFGTDGQGVNDISSDKVDEIGHWALIPDVADFLIVEKWEENTKKVLDAAVPGNLITTMGNQGYLNVTAKIGARTYNARLPITDMNTQRFDYTWGKVVLPFASEFEVNTDYSKVCTGWKITSVTKEGTIYVTPSVTNYDFADRDNPQKDLFNASTNPYVFAQGGNYIVPYGVTAITIEANFADAFYLSDASYDVGYDADFENATPLGGSVPDQYHEKNVYTSLSSLVSNLATTTNPHAQAIVLVGNYHYRVSAAGQVGFDTRKAVTIMSVDEDCNQEPDYGWYMGNTHGRIDVPPLRFDFVPNIEMGRSQRVDGRGPYPGVGIWHTRGWFELTETCVSNMIQCEINSFDFTNGDNEYGNNRWIANSGCFVQIVRARDGNCNKLSYIQIGGNAYVKELYPGSHTDNARTNKAVPILVTGGQVDECYMTGYKAGGKLTGNIYFWCAGGKIGKFLGAYLEEPSTANADLTAKVDHALIGRFFGGGTSAAARVRGNIDITINNSQVDFYCGGPEFGDMYPNKTVTTHATGTTFGVYYGAGFGGTSITYDRKGQTAAVDITTSPTAIYDLNFNLYTNNRLVFASGFGIGNCYKFEFIFNSNGKTAVSRFYTGYAQFSLATTGNVTNVLDHCTVTGNFYGAGCQGKVNGTVSSTLTDCSINGNAFGAGYKATANELDVYPTTQPDYSVYNREMGIFSDFGTVDPGTFTWAQGDATTQNTVSGTTLYTSKDVDMSTLGTVTNNVTLILNGGTTVGTGSGDTGNVYGGGEESGVMGNTTVNLQGGVTVHGNVYGGGNRGAVGGDSQVIIQE